MDVPQRLDIDQAHLDQVRSRPRIVESPSVLLERRLGPVGVEASSRVQASQDQRQVSVQVHGVNPAVPQVDPGRAAALGVEGLDHATKALGSGLGKQPGELRVQSRRT